MLSILICLSSCEYVVTQAQLTALFALDTVSTLNSANPIPITPIASFAAKADTETAYKQFCKDLCQIGITEDIIRQKEDKILEVLKSQGMVSNSQIVASDTREEDQVLEAAYKQFCEELLQIGVTEDLILPKYKVLGILKSRVKVASRQSGGSNMGDQG